MFHVYDIYITHTVILYVCMSVCFPGSAMVKDLPADAGDVGSILGLRRSPGVESGNKLKYS